MIHHYDLSQGAIGALIRVVLRTKAGLPAALDSGTDSVVFELRYEHSADPPVSRNATISDGPNGIIDYETIAGDLSDGGVLLVRPVITAPSRSYTGPSSVVRYHVEPAI